MHPRLSFYIPLALLLCAPLAFATPISDMTSHTNSQLQLLVEALYSIGAPLAMGMFVFAGLVYSVGQAFDKNTREKAKNWSMSIVTGVGIGVLVMVAAPFVVSLISGMGG